MRLAPTELDRIPHKFFKKDFKLGLGWLLLKEPWAIRKLGIIVSGSHYSGASGVYQAHEELCLAVYGEYSA